MNCVLACIYQHGEGGTVLWHEKWEHVIGLGMIRAWLVVNSCGISEEKGRGTSTCDCALRERMNNKQE